MFSLNSLGSASDTHRNGPQRAGRTACRRGRRAQVFPRDLLVVGGGGGAAQARQRGGRGGGGGGGGGGVRRAQFLPRYLSMLAGVTNSNGTHSFDGTGWPRMSFRAASTAPRPCP